SAGDIQRLWPTDAICSTPLKGMSQMNQVGGIVQFTMTVDDYQDVSLGRSNAHVAGSAGPTFGISQKEKIGVVSLQRRHDVPSRIRGLPIYHNHLVALWVVLLRKEWSESPLNVAGLIVDGNNHGNKRDGIRGAKTQKVLLCVLTSLREVCSYGLLRRRHQAANHEGLRDTYQDFQVSKTSEVFSFRYSLHVSVGEPGDCP